MTRSSSHFEETPERGVESTGQAAEAHTYLFDRESVRNIDQAAVAEYRIPGIVLMENAAIGLAEAALEMLAPAAGEDPSALIICGGGNNGGDGYALARHLHNVDVRPILLPLSDPKPDTDAEINCNICRAMNLTFASWDEVDTYSDVDLIVDAIFGTGLDRAVSGPAIDAIKWINAATPLVMSVDLPSGLDCDTGQPLGAAVRADCTVTFVGVKQGFMELDAQGWLGDVMVADIGAPIELIERFGKLFPSAPPVADPPGSEDSPSPRS